MTWVPVIPVMFLFHNFSYNVRYMAQYRDPIWIMIVDIWYVFVHTNVLFFCLCVAGVHLCSLYLLYKQLNTRHNCHSSIAVKVQVYIITWIMAEVHVSVLVLGPCCGASWLNVRLNAVYFSPGPCGPLPCMFQMVPCSNTPDSNHCHQALLNPGKDLFIWVRCVGQGNF